MAIPREAWLFHTKPNCTTAAAFHTKALYPHCSRERQFNNAISQPNFSIVTSLFQQLFLLCVCSSETIKLWHFSMVFFKISFTHTPPCFNHLIKMDTSGTGSNLHKRAHFFSPGQPALMTAILLQPSHLLKQLKARSNRFLKSLHNTVNFCCVYFFNTNAVITLSHMKEWTTCFILNILCMFTTSQNKLQLPTPTGPRTSTCRGQHGAVMWVATSAAWPNFYLLLDDFCQTLKTTL